MPTPLVLYVEDEENDLFFMQRAFQQVGLSHAVRTLTDGQAAMDYLAGKAPYADRNEHPLPRVVLLDLNLPTVHGFEVLHWMRQQPQLQSIPVVVFSSSGRQEDRTTAVDLGATDFVQKPSSGLDFIQVAQQLRERWMTESNGSSFQTA
jgi:CheY-like chemotaxis protein